MKCSNCGSKWSSPSKVVLEKCPFCQTRIQYNDEDSNDYYKSDLTIEEVLDVETNEIIFSEEFFSQTEDVIIKARNLLEIAIQSDASKFNCLFCDQKVKISGRWLPKINRNIYYFSHLVNSDDCPIKTGTNLNLKEILIKKYKGYKESDLHRNLKNIIAERLRDENSKNKGVTDVATEKIFKNLDITENWRRPDVRAIFNDKSLVFELQLSTTFLSVVVGRDTFYKMHNTFIIWIFPFFNLQEEWQKLMEKDIYYTHKRNVFVLDDEAMNESKIRSELILKCYWQLPVIFNEEVQIEWKNKLISLDELTFDYNNYETYYYNSDIDFYNCSNPKQQALLDAWEDSKEERWNKLFYRNSKFSTSNFEFLPNKLSDIVYDGKHWGYRNSYGEMITPYKYDKVYDFSEGNAKVKLNNKFGFINSSGREITQIIFDDASKFENGVASVKINDKYGLINLNGLLLTDIKYDKFYHLSNNFVIVSLDGKNGVCDLNISKEIIPTLYEIKSYRAGVGFKVSFNNKYGVINESGETIIPIKYEDIRDFSEGLVCVLFKNKYGYINFNDEFIIEPTFEIADGFRDGFAFVYNGEKTGVIDKSGNIIIPIKYDSISNFGRNFLLECNEEYFLFIKDNYEIKEQKYEKIGRLIYSSGLALVKSHNKYGFIDEFGNEKIPLIYDYAEDFENSNLAKVVLNNKWGYIDENGYKVCKFKYDFIGHFWNNNFAIVKLNRKEGVINENLKEVITTKYDSISTETDGSPEFIDGFGVKVSINKKWGIVNFQNKVIIPLKYDEIGSESGDLLEVKLNNKFGYVNAKGEEIIPLIYDWIYSFYRKGIAKVKLNNKFGYINTENKIIIPIKYDTIDGGFNENFFVVSRNDKFGFVDLSGKEVIPLKFDFASAFSKGVSVVKLKTKFGLINEKGNQLTSINFDEIKIKFLPIVKSNNKYGVLNFEGHELIPIIYEYIDIFCDNICVKLHDKYGLFNMQGEIVLPIHYEEIKGLHSNYIGIKNNGKWQIVNKLGVIFDSFLYDNLECGLFSDYICKAFLNNKSGYIHLSGKWV